MPNDFFATCERDENGWCTSSGGSQASALAGALYSEQASWGRKVPKDQKNALEDYVGTSDKITELLKDKDSTKWAYSNQQRTIRSLTKLIDSAPGLSESVEVFRGLPKEVIESIKAGSTYKDPAFASTSVDKGTAEAFGIPVIIRVPKGTKAVYVDAISQGAGEMELLLQRGSTYRMTGEKDGTPILTVNTWTVNSQIRNDKKASVRRLDPTRTTQLRRQFARALKRKFRRLKGDLLKWLVVDDSLGMRRMAANAFDPDQPRDEQGQWTSGGGGSSSVVIRLGGTIGEKTGRPITEKAYRFNREGLRAAGDTFYSRERDYVEAFQTEVGGKGTIEEKQVELKNPLHVDARRNFSDPSFENPIIKQAKADGHDGVIFSRKDGDYEDEFYVVFGKMTTNAPNSFKFASSPEKLITNEEFFSTCDRNDKGWCMGRDEAVAQEALAEQKRIGKEVVRAFSKDGNPIKLESKGSRYGVKTKVGEEGATVVHTHPFGQSLSAEDLFVGSNQKVRVVSVAPDGSHFEAKVAKEFNNDDWTSIISQSSRATDMVLGINRLPTGPGQRGRFKTEDDLINAQEHVRNLILHEAGVIDYSFRLGKDTSRALKEYSSKELRKSVKDAAARMKKGDFAMFRSSAAVFKGMKRNELTRNAPSGRFKFATNPQKLAEFKRWLRERFKGQLTGKSDAELWERFVKDGFSRGAGRAFDDVQAPAKAAGRPLDESRQEFLRSAFGRPETREKIELLASRSFDDLANVTDDMATKMGRVLADGLSRGANPREVAKELDDELDIGYRRAETIARTEIIRAHAEGQLDAFDRLGVEEIGVMVEWRTAGDDRVCPQCESMEGVVLRVEEAHGMIPAHPQCRCAFLPANLGEDRDDQIRGKSAIERAIDKSGFGFDSEISKDRPRSLLGNEALIEFSRLVNEGAP